MNNKSRNYVERTRRKIAVNENAKRTLARKNIIINLDENKQVVWFLDFVKYEVEKKKYTREYIAMLKKIPYKRYLMTPHWERVKKAAYGRFGKVCFSCSKARNVIHVHHLTYENRGCENMQDLMLLCADCHEMVHETMKQCEESEKKYINAYLD